MAPLLIVGGGHPGRVWLEILWDSRCVVCRAAGTYLCTPCEREATSNPVQTELDGVPVMALGFYSGALQTVVRAAKNYRSRAVLHHFRHQLRDMMQHGEGTVVPIPSSGPGMVRRGYGLGEYLAGMMRLPTSNALILLDGGTQRGRSALERRSFRPFRARRIDGPVVLVDDVITTGSTVRAAIRALRDAGCDVIRVVVLAVVPTRDKPLPKRAKAV